MGPSGRKTGGEVTIHEATLNQLKAEWLELAELEKEEALTFQEYRVIQRKMEHIEHQIGWINNYGSRLR